MAIAAFLSGLLTRSSSTTIIAAAVTAQVPMLSGRALLRGLPESALVSWLLGRCARLCASYVVSAHAAEASGRDLHLLTCRHLLHACLSVCLSCLVPLSVCLCARLHACPPVILPVGFQWEFRKIFECCVSGVRAACYRKVHESKCKQLTKQQLRV